jgi:hypothetical protein
MVYPVLLVMEKYFDARLAIPLCFLGGGVHVVGQVARGLGVAPLRQQGRLALLLGCLGHRWWLVLVVVFFLLIVVVVISGRVIVVIVVGCPVVIGIGILLRDLESGE